MSAHPALAVERHTAFEDAQALVTGTLFIALGVALFKHAGLLTGGTAGLAFLLHYATGWSFGAVFFVLNLPFYWLAWRRMGAAFTVKTFVAVALLSVFTELQPWVIGFQALTPAYAAVMGGLLMGAGFLMLFRHRASLGGVGILALYLQDSRGWRAGKVQMAIDCAIVAAAFAIVDPQRVVYSVVGAVALNLILAINHKPGRYVAM
ncbi:YitT family protein [Caldimonas aquatica]|uniref:YitT family protein n=1 Tax=Caldimonas aquatica TaxID=376175 RepID=A0ABY6MU09_9BURK|nr:YitT family protein [Schlegelella aquatica]UZD55492.1 YitT family protein [Schlegelella aquatica]